MDFYGSVRVSSLPSPPDTPAVPVSSYGSVCEKVSRSVRWSDGRSVGRSAGWPAAWTTGQMVRQTEGWSDGRSDRRMEGFLPRSGPLSRVKSTDDMPGPWILLEQRGASRWLFLYIYIYIYIYIYSYIYICIYIGSFVQCP